MSVHASDYVSAELECGSHKDGMNLNGKIAVITGASRGIGKAVALRLAGEGAAVIITYRGDAEAAKDTLQLLTRAGGTGHALRADGADLDQICRCFQQIADLYPAIDILVNNAGTASTQSQPISSIEPGEYDRLFNLNTRGLFFTTQEALKLMRDGGRIVNISSLASRLTAPGRSAYAGTKAAVEAFTRVWAAELGSRGITVNSVSPGAVATERFQQQMSPEAEAALIRMTPLARVGQPEDIADIVAFLCGEEGRWLTAQNLLAGGGIG